MAEEPKEAPKVDETALARVDAKTKAELMTPADKKEGEKLWKETVDKLKTDKVTMNKCILVTLWEKGAFVQELLDNPNKYGGHVVKDLAEEIDETVSQLYFYRRMHEVLKPEVVQKYSQWLLPWHAVMHLITVKDEKERDTIGKKYADKKIDVDQLRLECKEANNEGREEAKKAGKKTDNRGAPSPLKTMVNVTKIVWKLEPKLEELVKMQKLVLEIEDENRLKSTLKAQDECREALEEIYVLIEKILKNVKPEELKAKDRVEEKKK